MNKGRHPGKESLRMIKLFEIAGRPLTINEIMVGYYRLYKEVKSKRQIHNRIYQLMIHSGKRIVSIGTKKRAIYKLKEGKMTNKKLKELLESHGFNVEKTKDGWDLQQYTPAGEDWNLHFVDKEDMKQYCENYDPEDDFCMWIEARKRDKTVPGPMELWKDQLWKQELLNQIGSEI